MNSLIEHAMTDTQSTDPAGLSDRECETLLLLVRCMIPPNPELGVPGADDPDVFADILRSVDRDRAVLREALRVVDEIAGGRLADLPEPEQADKLAEFRIARPDLARVIESATARCYYRDDRVIASIGMAVRPPFPRGYEVEPGDWSLLDPVRSRGKIYRDAE